MKKLFTFLALLVFNSLVGQEIVSSIYSNKSASKYDITAFGDSTYYIRLDNNGGLYSYVFSSDSIYTLSKEYDLDFFFTSPLSFVSGHNGYYFEENKLWYVNFKSGKQRLIDINDCYSKVSQVYDMIMDDGSIMISFENRCNQSFDLLLIEPEKEDYTYLGEDLRPTLCYQNKILIKGTINNKAEVTTLYDRDILDFLVPDFNALYDVDPVVIGDELFFVGADYQLFRHSLIDQTTSSMGLTLADDDIYLSTKDYILYIENLDGEGFLESIVYNTLINQYDSYIIESPDNDLKVGAFGTMDGYHYYLKGLDEIVIRDTFSQVITSFKCPSSNPQIFERETNDLVVMGRDTVYMYDSKLTEFYSYLSLDYMPNDVFKIRLSSKYLTYMVLPLSNTPPKIITANIETGAVYADYSLLSAEAGIFGPITLIKENDVFSLMNQDKLYVLKDSFEFVTRNAGQFDDENITAGNNTIYLLRKNELNSELLEYKDGKLDVILFLPLLIDITEMKLVGEYIFFRASDGLSFRYDLVKRSFDFLDNLSINPDNIVYFEPYYFMNTNGILLYSSTLDSIGENIAGYNSKLAIIDESLYAFNSNVYQFDIAEKRFEPISLSYALKPSMLRMEKSGDYFVFSDNIYTEFQYFNYRATLPIYKGFKARVDERQVLLKDNFVVLRNDFEQVKVHHIYNLKTDDRLDFNFGLYGVMTDIAVLEDTLYTLVHNPQTRVYQVYKITNDLSFTELIWEKEAKANFTRKNNIITIGDHLYCAIGDQFYAIKKGFRLVEILDVNLSDDGSPVWVDGGYIYYVGLDPILGRQMFKYRVDELTTSTISSTIDEILIYPNPTSNLLNIDGLSQSTSYEIYDSYGQSMMAGEVSKSIDVQSLPTGIYFLELNGKMHKFITTE